jgi:hypothetical protein
MREFSDRVSLRVGSQIERVSRARWRQRTWRRGGFDVNQIHTIGVWPAERAFRVEATGALMRARSSARSVTLITVWLPAARIENSVANTRHGVS